MLNDQAPRHDTDPESLAAKLLRARQYLRDNGIDAMVVGKLVSGKLVSSNAFKYESAEMGSRVLRPIRRRSA